MPNYCRRCCKQIGIQFNPQGKTCYSKMRCDLCGKRFWWYEEEGIRRFFLKLLGRWNK